MLEILYQDEFFIAINKPGGLLVHRTRIAEERNEFAVQKLRDQIKQRVYPVHRLDRPTSGVLLFAKNKESLKAVSKLFYNKEVKKEYLAIVRGYTDESGVIDHPIKKDNAIVLSEPIPAITNYKRLNTIELPIPVGRYQTARYSLVSVEPVTGRMHQIRRHFKHINHHILGDKRYGDWRHNKMILERYETIGMFLVAKKLKFVHPHTCDEVTVEAPITSAMAKLFDKFEWE